MKKYKVTITERLEMVVEVEAETPWEAEEKVEEDWNKEEYVLDYSHFNGADFTAAEIKEGDDVNAL